MYNYFNKPFFRYSNQLQKWGFEKVPGDRHLHYICELPVGKQNLQSEQRSYKYGFNIDDDQKIPRGPYFIKQPRDVVFDGSRKGITNDITLKYVYYNNSLEELRSCGS